MNLNFVLRQGLEFPGGRVAFTNQLNFISGSADKRIPCYRVLDDFGNPIHIGFSPQVKSSKKLGEIIIIII